MAVVLVKIETADVAKSATTLLTVARFVHNADVVLAVARVANNVTVVLVRMAVRFVACAAVVLTHEKAGHSRNQIKMVPLIIDNDFLHAGKFGCRRSINYRVGVSM